MDINELQLTLCSRPKLRDIKTLAKDQDIFVTLLMDDEDAKDIGVEVKKAGRSWWHCPFSVLPMQQKKYDFKLVIFTVEKLCQALIEKQRIFIHCDARIDRTGTITLATLISLGIKKRQAVGFLISKQPGAQDRLHLNLVDKVAKSVLTARKRSNVNPNYYPNLIQAYSE
jgi:hypothetical protein